MPRSRIGLSVALTPFVCLLGWSVAVAHGQEATPQGVRPATAKPADRRDMQPQSTGGDKALPGSAGQGDRDEMRTADSPARPASQQSVSSAIAKAATGRTTDPDAAVVCEPSQGRPIFMTPGDTFTFVMRVSDKVSGDVSFSLAHAREPQVRYPLKPTTPPAFSGEYCMLLLAVPSGAEPGLYDIEVRSATGPFYSRRCVRVMDEFKNRFRFVHLSDMNVGELTAPEFDEMLPREVNLLAPEFIIATGDYTEWARARDDADSWTRVLRYFEQFTAPVYLLCGARDHEASFTRRVANKPIGSIDYGDYHGLLLLDHSASPLEQDYNQIQWIEADLKRNRRKKFNFICANSDELGLLDVWRESGDVTRMVHDYRVRFILTGGATDWDFKEFAHKLADLPGLHYIRTHQASTALRDRATGVSHYRVIEVDGDEVAYVYPDDNATEKLQHSIPVGRLRAFYAGPNDGTRQREMVTVQNSLNQPFRDAGVWLRVAKAGKEPPVVAPGKLIRALDAGSHWACEVGFDLPDKGSVRIIACSEKSDVPPALPIDVALDGPAEWTFIPQETNFGLSYFRASQSVGLTFANRSDSKLTFWPVIRVNGQELAADSASAPRLPLTLAGGERVTVPLVMNVRRVSPGPHKLQVYFLEDPLCRQHLFDVTMATTSDVARSANADQP